MKINITKTANYATFGNKNTAKTLWIVLHGYGQLCKYFIRNFNSLNEDENFVVAPEGLHRFYLKDTSGRVGASWMTKEERLDDIQNNITYLDKVLAYSQNENIEKTIVLGFSQGASTAARWIASGGVKPAAFVMWAGVFPPDVKLEDHQKVFENIPMCFVVGDNDAYFSEENIAKVKTGFHAKGMNVKWLHFEGKHQILPAPLTQLEKII